MKDLKFITKVLHTGFAKADPHGSLRMPVYDNAAFEYERAEDIEAAFEGKRPSHIYSRITNPTVEQFERQMQAITGARGVLALSSGMAAISNTIIAIAGSGDNIITSRHLFGNTISLFDHTLKGWGLEVRYVDLTKIEEAEKLIDEKTKAVFFETITNPQLEVVDVRALAGLTRSKGILLIADTTLTPPYMFSGREYGIDIEILSSTKYISGGATSVGGLIIDNGFYDWSCNEKFVDDARKYGPYAFMNRLRREVYRNIGSCLSPHNAYLQSLGLETLGYRIETSTDNTRKLAQFLHDSPQVKGVNYPGLADSPYYKISMEQFGGRGGALLTFDLKSKEECFRFINRLKIIRRATNLQDNRTLILHPASTIFAEYSPGHREAMGIRETMIRLAVGIEDSGDLIDDIKNGLEGEE